MHAFKDHTLFFAINNDDHGLVSGKLMRIAYGDLIGGISGDMFVAAPLDLGLSFDVLNRELRKIPTLKFELKVVKKTVHSIAATSFQVKPPSNEAPRSWKQIRQLLETSELAHEVKETSVKIFSRLAEAEGKIHGVTTEEVHFHEVGATDSIVDIVAACSRLSRAEDRRLCIFPKYRWDAV